jgi:hypothetical protein
MFVLIAFALTSGALYAVYRLCAFLFAPSRASVVPHVRNAHRLLGHSLEAARLGLIAAHEKWAAEFGHVFSYGHMFNVHLRALRPRACFHGQRRVR